MKDSWPVVRCSGCTLVYVDATLDRAALEDLYGRDYYEGAVFDDYLGERELRLASARGRVRQLMSVAPSGRLLDVGCAAGYFLHAASERYDVTGVEVSAFAAAYARREFGAHVFTGEIFDAPLEDDQFDLVTMWDVLEHVTDPGRVLGEIARVTRPDGLLVITTGNVDGPLARRDLEGWNLMTPPAHLTFFSPRTIEPLLVRSGFQVERLVADGFVSTRPRLVHSRVRAVIGTLGVGNVMTVFARRVDDPQPRRLVARLPAGIGRSAPCRRRGRGVLETP